MLDHKETRQCADGKKEKDIACNVLGTVTVIAGTSGSASNPKAPAQVHSKESSSSREFYTWLNSLKPTMSLVALLFLKVTNLVE